MNYDSQKIEWEYDLVELPFCQQLQSMGWTWLEGDKDVPELTERESFREVLLKKRLAEAIRRINPGPDGLPWLDETRIEKAIRQLENNGGLRLMEANQRVTELLLKAKPSPKVCRGGMAVAHNPCGTLISMMTP